MKQKHIVYLIIFICSIFGTAKSYAGFLIHSKHCLNIAPAPKSDENAPESASAAYPPPHGGGHHGGGHHSHGGHSHHSYHYHGHSHHYAEHYQHYHEHFHIWHEGRVGGTDYAGLSILFDILGLIPIGVFSILGVVFGALGMRFGMRRELATVGFFIGILEVIAVTILAILLLPTL